jgi:outer membrane protein OmpA-like peptidoglycan-associated protein
LRPVDVGDWNNDGWVITNGLKAGEDVVVDGGGRLAEGASVKATPYTTPAAAGPRSANEAKSAAAQAVGVGNARASVRFARGQATLDDEAIAVVRAQAAAVMGIGTAITITGYADRTGNAQANVDLAKRRAIVVRDALVAQGVNAERIRLLPPVSVTGSGTDDEARRVDIAVAN